MQATQIHKPSEEISFLWHHCVQKGDFKTTELQKLNWFCRGNRKQTCSLLLKLYQKESIRTKQILLEAKFFDPIGWLCPIVVNFKMRLQRLYTRAIELNEELPHACYKNGA